jgi:nicotinate-nucleotide adenylyltransferase
MVRLGVMGGTFNPIHYGHLVAANEVCEAFALDTVIFVPASIPPHKDQTEIIEARHRLMMAMLATMSHPHFAVSSMEVDRPGASYSVDTIAQVKQMYPEPLTIYFILGIDAFVEIASWRQPDVLLRSCHTIITSRPGYNLYELAPTLLKRLSELYSGLKFEPVEEGKKLPVPSFRVSNTAHHIFLHEVSALDISSTRIRQRVKAGHTVAYLLPEAVDAYIQKYQLYC